MPGGELAVWLDEWSLFVWLGLVGIFVPLLFPDGRLPSPRWRPVAWLGGVAIVAGLLGTAFGSGSFEPDVGPPLENPLALPGALGDALAVVADAGGIALAPVTVAALCAVVVRLRRSRGVERQQVKWFAAAMTVLLVGLTAAGVSAAFDERGALLWVGSVGWGMFLFGLLIALPAAVGIAILRHRLYDIDLVINRALVYGALTLLLAGAYVGLVLLLGLALSPLTSGSDLAIALSTLAVAALFRPAARSHAGPGGPALLPAQVRRRPHPGALRRPPALPDRPGGPARRADRRRGRDHAAGPRVAVAAGRGRPMSRAPRPGLVALGPHRRARRSLTVVFSVLTPGRRRWTTGRRRSSVRVSWSRC